VANDKKWIYMSYIIATFLVAWVFDQALILIAETAQIRNSIQWGLLRTSTLISFPLMIVVAFLYFRQEKVRTFSIEVMQELHKVTWPVRKSVGMSTIVVIIGVAIVAGILGIYDWVCAQGIGLILGS
jgi:preprotein translocase SecE subunit